MTYEETLAQIHALRRFKKVPGLVHLRKLLQRLGNPQKALSFVHVAGTNGKGSTSAMIAAVLQQAGYRTGLFVSPFITDFCERMQLNGVCISRAALVQVAAEVLPFVLEMERQGEEISEFEVVTAMGFCWFAKQKCEVVVLEVGLGGRLDATNVIAQPLCAVLTPISYDHTELLGDTLTQIAGEKCGILKQGCEVVCAPGQPPEAMAVIRRTAKERNCRLTVAQLSVLQETGTPSLGGTRLQVLGQETTLHLLGGFQVQNAATAIACVQVLHDRKGFLRLTPRTCAQGLAAARFPARLECLRTTSPVVLIDGAHNPGGAHALAQSLRRYLPGKRCVAVTGMCADKDTAQFVQTLSSLFAAAVVLPLHNPRGLPAQELAALWRQAGVAASVQQAPGPGLAKALHLAGPQGAVVVCGSLYLAGEVRPVAQQMLAVPFDAHVQ